MQTFRCGSCASTVYFENTACMTCGSPLGFDPASLRIVSLTPQNGRGFRIQTGMRRNVSYCANAQHGACNWLIEAADVNGLCRACDNNRTVPDLSDPAQVAAWIEIERAKKRLVYGLLRLGLPVPDRGGQRPPLMFDFVQDGSTGHLDGVITIDIDEADTVHRERQRQQFDEPYRTLLGHLRHESGHYYWMLLIENTPRLEGFRALFGDERADYQAALEAHYQDGTRAVASDRHVSSYASVHPWEDFAETWAHYLHMVDVVDTAEAQGVVPGEQTSVASAVFGRRSFDAYEAGSFDAILQRFLPLALALNSLNRSMGHPDFYPFVIPAAAVEKLGYIHHLVRASSRRA